MTESQENLKSLNAIDRATIEMRYAGKSYSKIEEDLAEQFGEDAPKLSTIKNNFAEGGRLFEIYYDFANKMNEGRDREALVYWRGLIMNAVAVVSEEMAEGCPRRLDAARMVIESLWGKSVQPVEVKAEVNPYNKYANVSTEELERRLASVRAELARKLAREQPTNTEESLKNDEKGVMPG